MADGVRPISDGTRQQTGGKAAPAMPSALASALL
jgi:hypothetical protein